MKIALAGNPNTGKTTLFNALTGANQFVGNWPGVTVEKKEGKLKGHRDVILTDLPGIYSFSPYTLEEVVARNYLIEEHPDVILNIIDGTNLERNLYLTTQLMELGIPVVVAVNMMDLVQKNGDVLRTKQLSDQLGCAVIEISALKSTGIQDVVAAVLNADSAETMTQPNFQPCVENAITDISEKFLPDIPQASRRWYAVKLFERDEKMLENKQFSASSMTQLETIIKTVEEEMEDDAESIITNERYTYIASIVKQCYRKKNQNALSVSDKIDRIVTNRFLALPIFAAVMFLVYYVSITTVGAWATDFTNDTLFGGWITDGSSWLLEKIGCADWLTSLIVDGIIGGVGAVLGFVPQMLVLFLFLGFLESCGYMARIAFVMDRIFRRFGLSGKSFIPMLIGSGCGIPGIMASRTIESERDRRMTIMTTTFIPCGAKLPIIGLIAGAFFGNAGWVAWSAYFIGVAAIIVSGIMLKKTRIFSGDPAPFVMELPAYHLPTPGNILRSMWERGWSFIKKAGTIILLSTIVLWFLQGFGVENGSFGMVEDMNNSVLASIGSLFAFIFAPLGWGDWKAAVGAVTGLIAKENVVSTFGVLYGIDGLEDMVEEGAAIQSFGGFTALSAFSYLVFNLLCAPCFAAMGAIRREMNSAKWTAFAIGYQCVFAYAVSLCIYQIGSAVTGNVNVIGLIAAIAVIAFLAFMLFRPQKQHSSLEKAAVVG